jgi:hypothetical protein
MKLLIMQFSPTNHFIPLGPNILFSTLSSNTLSLYPSLNVRDIFRKIFKMKAPPKCKNTIMIFVIMTVYRPIS